MDYTGVVEKAEDGSFSAYVPELPGCVTCGETEEEARELIKEAIILHLDSMRRHGEPAVPPAVRLGEAESSESPPSASRTDAVCVDEDFSALGLFGTIAAVIAVALAAWLAVEHLGILARELNSTCGTGRGYIRRIVEVWGVLLSAIACAGWWVARIQAVLKVIARTAALAVVLIAFLTFCLTR